MAGTQGLAGSGLRTALLGLALAAGAGATAGRAETLSFEAREPSVRWAAGVGEEDRASDEIDGISVGPDGSTLVAGVMRGDLVMGGQTFRSAGEGDVFLASVAPDGMMRWARQYGGAGDDNAYDVATDAAGNVYTSGWFAGDVDFGGAVLRSAGGQDMFVTKHDPEGRLVWAQSLGGPRDDGGNEIAVLANGEIAVSLESAGGPTVAGTAYPAGGGSRDVFLVRMSRDGAVRWVSPFAGTGSERIRAVAINDAGEVFLGFEFRGSLRVGAQTFESRGDWDGALVKLGADGAPAWGLPMGGAGWDNVRGVGVALDGGVYASGKIEGAAFLFDREVPAIGAGGDDYLVRLSGSGQPQWIVSLGSSGPSTGPELESDGRGVVVSAVMAGRAVLRRNRDVLAEFDRRDRNPTSYLAAFTPEGAPRWVWTPESGGGGSGAMGDVLALSRDGRFLAQALRFRGSLDVEGRAIETPGEADSVAILLDLNDS